MYKTLLFIKNKVELKGIRHEKAMEELKEHPIRKRHRKQ
jgi:hypothetical protein